VRHEETGLLVGEAALGGTIAGVLCDDGLRAQLGRAARARARQLSWERTAAMLFSLLDPALRPSRGAAPGST